VTRWTRRLLVGAIALLVPALAGCEAGFNAPTLQFHPAANGFATVFGGVTVDNAFVLGPALGSSLPVGGQAGVFLSLAAQSSDRLVSASAPGFASSVQLINGPVTLNPGTLVDLSGPTPQIVLNGLTSPLSGGQTIELTLDFATAGAVTLPVPVEPAAYDYTTYSPPTPAPPIPALTPAASPSASPSTTP
jgi:copper(I)-binding protein